MKRLVSFRFLLPPLLLAVTLGLVYAATLAPGLTWANNGADGGDLISAAATGGVPHPTGYPVYLLLAGLFQHIPIGPLALRTNLLSALATVGAALLVYTLVTRYLSSAGVRSAWLAGLASALAFGLASLTWSQAVITEVYALHVLFVALILYLSSGLTNRLRQHWLDMLTGLALGLGLGNHLTTIFLLPVVFAPALVRVDEANGSGRLFTRWRLDLSSLARRFGFMCIGLLTYFILPLRALSHPPVNWGNPVTWSNFAWLVSGRLYQDELLGVTPADIVGRTQSTAMLWLNQFGVVGLAVGFIGLVVFFSKSRMDWSMLWLAGVSLAFAISYGSRDSFVYLIPAFLCFAIWIGVGLGRLMEQVASRMRAGGVVLGVLFLAWLFFLAKGTWPQVDASHNQRAEQFGQAVLADAPPQAMLFTKGDEAVFSLWYFHYAMGNRPDVVVIASDLLPFDWYQQTLKSTYPSLNVPGPFPFEETIRQANPARPACYVTSTNAADVSCLPPTGN